MKHEVVQLFFMSMLMSSSHAADFLQNPDFESPPSNSTTANNAAPIPGWSSNGTVLYVSSSSTGNSSFPAAKGGQSLLLGQHGRINQTLAITGRDDVSDYILSFALAAMNADCANNRTAVNVSVEEITFPHSSSWRVLYLGGKNSNISRNNNWWEGHAIKLGQLGGGQTVNIEIATNNSGPCWPLVDSFTVKKNRLPRWYDGNMLANGDFEIGPPFLKNSSEGILLSEEQEVFNSPLQEWTVFGTVKYIDSKHYRVPHGKAAIELLYGAPCGVQLDLYYREIRSYTLSFTIGDANDSCVGDFLVYMQEGLIVRNITMRSNGTGSVFNHSVTFRPESSRETSIILYSFDELRNGDGVACGPVLDNVVLVELVSSESSVGNGIEKGHGVLGFSLFAALLVLIVF